MAWTKKLTQLNDVLAELVPNPIGIEKHVRNSGIKPQKVDFHGTALDIWNSVLAEADKTEKVNDLVSTVLKQYPNDPYLISALNDVDINYSLGPDFDEITSWKPISEETLEVLTYSVSTLLPIYFLEQGVTKSKSVAKVEIRNGSNIDVGTGFLFKIKNFDEVFFMTNYHVINNKAFIDKAKVIFNYELDIEGNSKVSKTYLIDDKGPWYSSPVHELDVSIFKLKDPLSDLQDYLHLDLKPTTIEKNDFVNIIQHPGGQMKQISLYHNIVTNSDNRVVQYLTDTLKGSSGAPVFNSQWDVVALHHSGGNKKTNEAELPSMVKSRNEGININGIISFLISKHK